MDIADELLRRAKRKAADDGVALKDVVEAALRAYLSGKPQRAGYKLRWTPVEGSLRPGVNLEDRSALWDLMDGLE